jgi:hypothetical protein
VQGGLQGVHYVRVQDAGILRIGLLLPLLFLLMRLQCCRWFRGWLRVGACVGALHVVVLHIIVLHGRDAGQGAAGQSGPPLPRGRGCGRRQAGSHLDLIKRLSVLLRRRARCGPATFDVSHPAIAPDTSRIDATCCAPTPDRALPMLARLV